MTELEKKKKVVSIAVAYYLEQEAAEQNIESKPVNERLGWRRTGKLMKINSRKTIQCRGKMFIR